MNAGRVEEAISMVEDMRSGIMKVGAVSSHLACDRPSRQAFWVLTDLLAMLSSMGVPLQDQRLLYVMKTRKFLELLRPGTEEARKAALGMQHFMAGCCPA